MMNQNRDIGGISIIAIVFILPLAIEKAYCLPVALAFVELGSPFSMILRARKIDLRPAPQQILSHRPKIIIRVESPS